MLQKALALQPDSPSAQLGWVGPRGIWGPSAARGKEKGRTFSVRE